MTGIEHILIRLKQKNILLLPDDSGTRLRVKGDLQQLTETDKLQLKEYKEALLAFLNRRAQLPAEIPVVRHTGRRYPLTPGQQQIWAHEQVHNDPGLYAINSIYRFDLPGFDAGRFQQALQQLVSMYDVLRTAVVVDSGSPFLETGDDQDVTGHLTVIHLPHHDETVVREDAEARAMQPFPGNCSPWHITVWHLNGDTGYFLLHIHHLLADGESVNLMVKNLLELYHNHAPAQWPAISFRDYAHWLNDRGQFAAAADFWKKELQDYDDSIALPLIPYADAGNEETEYHHTFPAALTKDIHAFCAASRTGLNALFTTVAGIVLARYFDTEDLVVGVPAAARTHPQLQYLAGNLVNNLPLRLSMKGDVTQQQLLQQVKEKYYTALDHQLYPFPLIMEDCGFKSRPGHYPLFSVMLSFPENIIRKHLPFDIHFGKKHSLYDLTCTVWEDTGGIHLSAEYNHKKFTADGIRRFVRQTEIVLKQVMQDAPLPLSAIRLYDAGEEAEIYNRFTRSSAPVEPAHINVLQMIREQMQRHPHATALVEDGKHVTYEHLWHHVQQWAGILQSKQLPPQSRVLVQSGASAHQLYAMLAIWLLKMVYVPADPLLPAHRLQQMIADCNPALVISEPALFFSNEMNNAEAGDIIPGAFGGLAYILYTSGTTGVPKGVMIEHSALAQKMQEECLLLDAYEPLVAVAVTAPVFDVSFLETVLPLVSGGCVVMPAQEEKDDPAKTAMLIQHHGVNILQGTPSYLAYFFHHIPKEQINALGRTLRFICSGGESLTPSLVQLIKQQLPEVQLNNHYGPTEATIDALAFINIHAFSCNNIGRPVGSTRAFVADRYGNLLPPGISGDLLLAGPSLSAGYWNNPGITAGKFYHHAATGLRVYNTGDRAMYMPSGDVVYLGRTDTQVKLNGFRIETEDITAALLQLPGIDQAYTKVTDNKLVSWICPATMDTASIRRELYNRLPAYMVPSMITGMEEIPLTVNGKTDEAKLILRAQHPGDHQQTELEAGLLQLWKQVLETQAVNVHDNFFAMGGHSLSALRLLGGIARLTGVHLRISDLWMNPDVHAMANYLSSGEVADIPPIIRAAEAADYPASYPQQQVWMASQHEAASVAHHMPAAFIVEALDVPALEKALHELLKRHEILRTGLHMNDEAMLRQFIIPAGQIPLPLQVTGMQDVASVKSITDELTNRPFDLSVPSLMRVQVTPLSNGTYLLAMVVHHIISDYLSDETMRRELFTLYKKASAGEESYLPEVPLQYKDYAVWQHSDAMQENMRRMEKFWEQQLSAPLHAARLPYDHPEPAVPGYEGEQITETLPGELFSLLQQKDREGKGRFFAYCLSAFWLSLYQYTGRTDMVFGCPVSGRNHPSLEHMPGLFLNMIALRVQAPADEDLSALVSRVAAASLDAFMNDGYPFYKARGFIRNNMGDGNTQFPGAVLNMIASTGENDTGKNMPHSQEDTGYRKSKFPLCLFVHRQKDKTTLVFEYQTALYKPHTIAAFARRYRQCLEWVLKHPGQKPGDFRETAKPQLPGIKMKAAKTSNT